MYVPQKVGSATPRTIHPERHPNQPLRFNQRWPTMAVSEVVEIVELEVDARDFSPKDPDCDLTVT